MRSTDDDNVDAKTRRYERSAIRMLFCNISEHILDEILISGKVQIIVSADYFMFRLDETDHRSTYNTDIRIFKIFQDRTFGYN